MRQTPRRALELYLVDVNRTLAGVVAAFADPMAHVLGQMLDGVKGAGTPEGGMRRSGRSRSGLGEGVLGEGRVVADGLATL